jgi:hypothetical protein
MFEEESQALQLGCRTSHSGTEHDKPAALNEVGTYVPVRDSEPILVLLAALNGCMMRASFPALSVSRIAFPRGFQKGEKP